MDDVESSFSYDEVDRRQILAQKAEDAEEKEEDAPKRKIFCEIVLILA